MTEQRAGQPGAPPEAARMDLHAATGRHQLVEDRRAIVARLRQRLIASTAESSGPHYSASPQARAALKEAVVDALLLPAGVAAAGDADALQRLDDVRRHALRDVDRHDDEEA